MVLSLVSLSNESCLLLRRNIICWQGFPPSYWRLLCLLLRSGTEERVSAGTQSLLPGASGLGFTRCLRTSWDQNFYGQLCTEKSLRVWQEAVFLMGGWKNHTEKVANYPTVKLKGRFFLIVTETLPLSGTEHWLWQKKSSMCLFCQWSKHFFFGVCFIPPSPVKSAAALQNAVFIVWLVFVLPDECGFCLKLRAALGKGQTCVLQGEECSLRQ